MIEQPYDAWAEVLPEMYRLSDTDDDIKFYRHLVDKLGRPCLEVGVGYGRVASVLCPEFAVDSSAAMLRAGEQQLRSVRAFHADIGLVELPEQVRFAYAASNVFDHLIDDAALEHALRAVWRLVIPGGWFAFDALHWAGSMPDQNVPTLMGADATTVIQTVTTLDDPATGVGRLRAIVERLDESGNVTSRRWLPPMPFRARTAQHLETILKQVGWNPVDRWGGFQREPLQESSQKQAWLVRKPLHSPCP